MYGIWHYIATTTSIFVENTPFPPKQQGVQRVVVVGDSLTYGAGIAEQHTYSAILQRLLEQRLDVEVLNLGISGYQTTDVLNLLQEYVPRLQP